MQRTSSAGKNTAGDLLILNNKMLIIIIYLGTLNVANGYASFGWKMHKMVYINMPQSSHHSTSARWYKK